VPRRNEDAKHITTGREMAEVWHTIGRWCHDGTLLDDADIRRRSSDAWQGNRSCYASDIVSQLKYLKGVYVKANLTSNVQLL
jgi:hypothetical protein